MDEKSRQFDEMLRHWKPPAELERGSREVELCGGGIAVTIVAYLLVAGAVAAAYGLTRLSTRQAADSRELRAAGIEGQAVVTRHFRSGDKNEQRRINYEFQYEGHTYRNTANTPAKIWSTLIVGSIIPVRFVPGRPELNHPADWQRDDLPAWVAGLVALGLTIPGLLLLYMIRRQRELLAEGRPAPAVVTGHRSVKGGKRVKYEFALLGGGIGKGGGGNSRKPPAVGSTITVIYDRDNPKRNAPYPFEMVRVVR